MKYVMSFALVVAIAMIAMFAFPPAPAKAVVPVFDMGMLTNTVSQDHNVKSEQRRAGGASKLLLSPDPAVSAPRLPETVLRYDPSVDQRTANFASFVKRTRRTDPQAAADLEQNVSPKIIQQIDQSIQPYGLSAYNLADAYAVWWVTAWDAVFDPTNQATRSQMQAVRRQAANAILVIPEFGNLTNAQKQELAEAYLLHASIIMTYIDYAQANPEKQGEVASNIKQGALKSGMDLDGMVLTEGGFQPR
ncbi:DUF6683 family protein [Qipengyuania qiaonensis]|uniref:Uncharacterized protein n=1 Tax=Qipengyuania qiaonensis TaxID=2867240 RepID=A0ABS7JAM1_9SPHN|nr:DUF6683 family protein [Qipengyuania qiaonensis]MBX7482743.1 hypothetical protein [Qipengyuania qiaonensis]